MSWHQEPSKQACDCLSNVVTVADVARAWQLAYETVRVHCLAGTFAARQSAAGLWLIYYPDVVSYYGPPKTELDRAT